MKKQRDFRTALFEAIAAGGMQANELSEISGVPESRISNFRNGRNINFNTLQRLIDALPPQIYDCYLNILLGEKPPIKSESQIAKELFGIAYQLKQNRIANLEKKKRKIAL